MGNLCRTIVFVGLWLLPGLPALAQPAAPALPPPPDSLRAVAAAARTPAEQVVTWTRIGAAYTEEIDPRAEPYLRAAEQLARRLADSVGVGRARRTRGYYLHLSNRIAQGLPELQAARRLLAAAPPRDRGLAALYLAQAYADNFQEKPALAAYAEAERLFQDANDRVQLAELANSKGVLYMNLERYGVATKYLYTAANEFRALRKPQAEAVTLFNIASVYVMQRLIWKADTVAAQSAAAARRAGDTLQWATALQLRAMCASERDDHARALTLLRQVRRLAGAHPGINTARLTLNFANAFSDLGLPDSVDFYVGRAIAMLEASGQIASPVGSIALANQAYARAVKGQLAEATALADRSEKLHPQLSADLDTRRLLVTVRRLAAAGSGRWPEAYRLLLDEYHLTDTVKSQRLNRATEELRTRYETDRAEQAARDASALAEAQQARARRLTWLAVGLGVGLLVVGALVDLLVRARRRQAATEAALRRADATKDRLMSIIGHDLRGPVANFQQAMPLVKFYADNPDPQELAGLADDLQRRAQQLGALLDNLLYWSRAQRDEVRNRPQAVAPVEALQAAADLYRPVAEAKGVTVRVAPAAPGLPATVQADPALLATVLRNLLSNAIKFTPAGGTITLAATRTPDDGRVAFEVADTGVGMTAQQVEHLFDVGADRSTTGTAGEGGTGLGLLVCEHFARLLGGPLMVRSEVGRGTRFAFGVAV